MTVDTQVASWHVPGPLSRPMPPVGAGGGAALPVRLQGVAKSFGALTVLHGIDLTIPAGQFLAIVGRSGCGKSTLLRLLAGLDTADAGTITIGDAARREESPVRLMFQEPRLLPWARIRRNVEVGLSGRVAGPQAGALAQEALARVGLAERAGEWPAVLSGGQKQRVALARALVSSPGLLALDEPLGALDALTRLEMQELIERVWTAQGFTALLVTHDVSEAVALADRVVVLDGGAVIADVTVDLPRPRQRGNARAAAIEGDVLRRLLGGARQATNGSVPPSAASHATPGPQG
jgi:sulfonate transport system ATP-binding protein